MILKFLTFLFVLYLLWKVFGFVFRALFVVMGRRAFERANERMQNNQQQNRRTRNADGSIHIDKKPPKDKNDQADFRGGEYVDYEEIKKKQ